MLMPKSQRGFNLSLIAMSLVVAAVIGLAGYMVFSHKVDKTKPVVNHSGQLDKSSAKSDSAYVSLPSINYFKEHKSDQFLVDYDVVATGHPFLGARALSPHQGAHVQFGDDWKTWPKGGTAASNYPKIYAVADGVVSKITDKFLVGSNDRYGINLTIAKDGDVSWDFEYSIEPFVPEPSPGFYKDFMLVKVGDKVKKGQVIGYMYTPQNSTGTHIHFEIINTKTQAFTAPAIFTPTVEQAFYDHWNNQGYDGSSPGVMGTKIPNCMGYMLSAEQNPFGTGATDCLD